MLLPIIPIASHNWYHTKAKQSQGKDSIAMILLFENQIEMVFLKIIFVSSGLSKCGA